MQLKNYFKRFRALITAFAVLITLSSCGSYRYAGAVSDGIYTNSEEIVEQQASTNKQEASTNKSENTNTSGYYQSYFKENANKYQKVSDGDNVIFTDIESYEGDYALENATENNYQSNPGWGEANENVTINIYERPGAAFGWGWNRPYWGMGFYNGWGYYNNWGWNSGFYDPFWCPPFYYPYNNIYLGNRYYNGIYGRRGYAYNGYRSRPSYNASRRGGVTRSRSGVYTRPRAQTQRGRTSRATRPRTSTTRPRSTVRPKVNNNSSRPRVRTNRSRTYSPSRSNSSGRGRTYNSGGSRPSPSRGSTGMSRGRRR